MSIYNFYSKYETGHRKEYIEFTQRHLSGNRVSIKDGLFSKKPLLFLMVEESFFIFFIVSVARSIFFLKTSALMFRVNFLTDEIEFKHIVKKFFCLFLTKTKLGTLISIVHSDVLPDVKYYCRHSIYDFQFWDRNYLEENVDYLDAAGLVNEISYTSKEKRTIVAIGKQCPEKGTDILIQTFLTDHNLRDNYTVILAGKLSNISSSSVNEFKRLGGVVVDRFISQSELVAMYKLADFIWCSYHESYDQSSGVLGRAIQYNKTPIVRSGSMAEKICQSLNVAYYTSSADKLNYFACAVKDSRNDDFSYVIDSESKAKNFIEIVSN